MRDWHKYLIRENNFSNNDRFDFTDEVLLRNFKNFKYKFKFKHFKKDQLNFTIYNFFKKELDHKKTLFIGSGWGWVEYFLNSKKQIIASDIREEYIQYHKKNTKLNYKKIDILNQNTKKGLINKYDRIVVNNIEYLLNKNQLKTCIRNLSKILKKNGDLFFIFRSRDGFVQRLIDDYLTYIELKLIFFIKKLKKKNLYFTKNHHGFRRKVTEFIKLFNSDFNYISNYTDLYETEYERLTIIKKIKMSKLISIIFFRSHPYLNIIHFKKN